MRLEFVRNIKKFKNVKIPKPKDQVVRPVYHPEQNRRRNPNDQIPNFQNQDMSTQGDLVCNCLKIWMVEFRGFLTLGFWIWELQAACFDFTAKS
jgi:hypothetical protein